MAAVEQLGGDWPLNPYVIEQPLSRACAPFCPLIAEHSNRCLGEPLLGVLGKEEYGGGGQLTFGGQETPGSEETVGIRVVERSKEGGRCDATSFPPHRRVGQTPVVPRAPGPNEAVVARQQWGTLEPFHAMIYFAPEANEAYAAAGLKGGWMGYFASRAGALGPVPAEVVTATFYNFAPAMVARAIPDAWSFSRPEAVLAARLAAADTALRRMLGDEVVASPGMAEAADLARRAAEACEVQGRPLFAGHASLPWPDPPHLQLWHAATLLREHRGDGHVAALLAEGVGGLEALLLMVGAGVMPRSVMQPARGWTDDEWETAESGLRRRGLLDETGSLTEAGQELRRSIEDRTDRSAARPYAQLGVDGTTRLRALVRPFSVRITEQGFPIPNPVGAPAP